MRKKEHRLTVKHRLRLVQTLSDLPTAQFEQIVFALQGANSSIPGSSASQASRCTSLLDWVESPCGPGLSALEDVLESFFGLPGLMTVSAETSCPSEPVELKADEADTANRSQPSRPANVRKALIVASVAFLLLLIFLTRGLFAKSTVVRVPLKDNYEYYYKLLELVLKATESEGKVVLKQVEIEGPQISELAAISSGEIDVTWTMTSFEREYYAHPIRFPLTQGLLAYRLCLTSRDHANQFEEVESFEDFQQNQYSVGQVIDWPDTSILREAGINVKSYETKNYLFDRLEQGEVDCFARGLNEIWDELDSHQHLVADDAIFFKYRAPVYYFTNSNNKALANRIERGLHILHEEGELCELLMDHFGDDIRKADLANRSVIDITNHDLPKETPNGYYLNFEIPEFPESRGECPR